MGFVKYALRSLGLEAQGGNGEGLGRWLADQSRCFPGYRIAERKAVSPDQVEIGVQALNGGGVMTLRLQKTGPQVSEEEWKIQDN